MKINCQKCGETVALNGLGRKCLGITVKNISDALRACQNVDLAAKKINCSRGYIYQELGKKGLKPRDVMSRSEVGQLGARCKMIEKVTLV